MNKIIVCPECNKVLNNEDYDSVSAYHNSIEYVCLFCGHHDLPHRFIIKQ